MEYRFVVELDTDPDLSYVVETAESYADNEAFAEGSTEPMTFEEYQATWGDPERYTSYYVKVERLCECCGSWVDTAEDGSPLEAVGGVDMYDEPWLDGTYSLDELPEALAWLRSELAPCTGTRYAINPDAPEEGSDIRHDTECPAHPQSVTSA